MPQKHKATAFHALRQACLDTPGGNCSPRHQSKTLQFEDSRLRQPRDYQTDKSSSSQGQRLHLCGSVSEANHLEVATIGDDVESCLDSVYIQVYPRVSWPNLFHQYRNLEPPISSF